MELLLCAGSEDLGVEVFERSSDKTVEEAVEYMRNKYHGSYEYIQVGEFKVIKEIT